MNMQNTSETDPPIGTNLIKAKVKTLPNGPGVYRMLGSNDDVLYVGKAKNLKNRVSSYTRISGHSNRIANMIRLTHNMEFIRTQTEADALLLEANLIQKFKPRFNVLMRDDKSLPYILLADDHIIPQITKHRGSRKRKGDYFGPFASPGAVNRTLNTLQKAFLLRSCSDSVYDSRTRPCLLHQIKRCSAPCTNEISPQDYSLLVKQARQFLSGSNQDIQGELAQQMQAASDVQDFELAAEYRDRIRALTYIQSTTDVFARTIEEADIISLAQEGGQSCIQVFFFRAGRNLGNKAYFPRHDKDTPSEEVLESFIIQFYENRQAPRKILLNLTLPSKSLLEEALSLKQDYKVNLTTPKRGEKADIVAHTEQNAREALARKLSETASQQNLLSAVAETFDIEGPIRRIEVFDNSHLGGTNQLGGMIVATEDGFVKNQYRKFNIKNADSVPGDDYAMMQEVLTRRYERMVREENADSSNRPDLILIDGGKGQLGIARKVMAELGLDIPLIGIAKGPDRNAGREQFFMPGRDVFNLPPNSPVLYYLQRLRDEAHRFAIGGHRIKRKKDIRANPLDDISGIGAKRKKALLHHFGSAKAVMRASLADLIRVEGISAGIAQHIYDHFNGEGS
ncbi:RNA polymerase sigma-54 factor protein [Candidatus Micropelagos thuwalensis]|uniref:UvrABC system protein C n=1 Tax=Candidatus Micropelagius thuwalensis TaxID=1397666 RepID=U2WVT4_9PROT|nr:excinuclease ABC subunit UvrC [Candidatus Micropelagos thuwalensis]ERL47650.1 RNA polymerase sigma-54 factor protein [Candidatus Micropelagos thuwalensis]